VDLTAAFVRADYQDGLREFADIRQGVTGWAMLQLAAIVEIGFHFIFRA